MRLIEDLRGILDKVETQQNTLLSIYRDEVKEYGKAKDDTIILSNALIFAIEKAYNALDNGLDGKFL